MKTISITSGHNGYPTNVREAVADFDNFIEAEAFAKQNGGELRIYRQRNGWRYWEDYGRAFEAFEVSAADLWPGGAELEDITPEQAGEYIREGKRLTEELAECDEWPAEILREELRKWDRLAEEVEALDVAEGQHIAVSGLTVLGVYSPRVMSYHDGDVYSYIIGVEA